MLNDHINLLGSILACDPYKIFHSTVVKEMLNSLKHFILRSLFNYNIFEDRFGTDPNKHRNLTLN